jgi:outer membrane protein TolC
MRTKAVLCELINGYGQTFLDALLEVENALAQEKQQVDLLGFLHNSIEIAKRNLEESQWHYINGLNDYLTVIAAIQSVQELERRIVSEKKQLLSIRTRLYLALGG